MYSLLKRQTGTQHKHIVCLPKKGKLATFYNLNAREKTNETDGTAREKEITAQQAVAVVQNRQWFLCYGSMQFTKEDVTTYFRLRNPLESKGKDVTVPVGCFHPFYSSLDSEFPIYLVLLKEGLDLGSTTL